jgi:cell division protein FtsB
MSFTDDVKKLLRRYGSTLLLLLVVLLVMDNIFGAHGLLAMRRAQKEIAAVKKQIERLNEENQELDGQVKALRSDPQLIEKIARDELGLARPGEVIIRVPPAPKPSPAPAKP